MGMPGLEFRLSAELADFMRGMSQGDRAVSQAMAGMNRSVQSFDRRLEEMGKSARESASVFQAFEAARGEFRQLEAQLNPAVRALRQYEAAQEMVAEAVRQGAVSQERANAVLERARMRYEQATGGIARASGQVTGRFAQMGGAMQQAGYQVGDFAVQVASGTNPLIAFTQQGSQLVSMFGPWGAVIGAAGAVVGALAVALWDSGEAASELEFDIGALESGVSGLEGVVRDYISAIEATGSAQRGATDQIVADSKREFEAKKKVLGVELELQKSRAASMRDRLASLEAAATPATYDTAGMTPQQIEGVRLAEQASRDAIASQSVDIEGRAMSLDQAVRYLQGRVELADIAIGEATEALDMSFEDMVNAGGDGSGSGAGKAADDFKRIAERLEQMATSASNQAHAMDLSAQEAAEFRAEIEAYSLVLEAAKNATPEQVAQLRQLAEAYIEAKRAVEEKRAAQESAKEAAREAQQAEEQLKRGLETLSSHFISAATQADSFGDALRRLLPMIAQVLVKGALLGEGPLGSLFNGGLFGQSGSSVQLPGTLPPRALGGPVRAGTAYMVGEHGKEPFVPAVDGRILSVQQAQEAMLGGTARGGDAISVTYAPTINAPGASAEAVQGIRAEIARDRASFEPRVVAAVRRARKDSKL